MALWPWLFVLRKAMPPRNVGTLRTLNGNLKTIANDHLPCSNTHFNVTGLNRHYLVQHLFKYRLPPRTPIGTISMGGYQTDPHVIHISSGLSPVPVKLSPIGEGPGEGPHIGATATHF